MWFTYKVYITNVNMSLITYVYIYVNLHNLFYIYLCLFATKIMIYN